MGAFGKLDILVNNAGIELYRAVTEMTEEKWDTLMDINLKGVFLCSKYAIPEMQAGGAIINMSSVAAYKEGGQAKNLLCLKGWRDDADAGDGGGTTAPRHPGQCPQPRVD